MLAALPKNLQKLGREKILDEKAAGAVCSPTWCTRFSAKCGHPLFTVISARALWRDPYFAALCLFSLPPRVPGHPEICFSKQRKIHILQARQIRILHHLHAYVAICKFLFLDARTNVSVETQIFFILNPNFWMLEQHRLGCIQNDFFLAICLHLIHILPSLVFFLLQICNLLLYFALQCIPNIF